MHQMKYPYECAFCSTKIRLLVAPNKVVKLPGYNEVTVRLNDGSKMVLGVCEKHTRPNRLELLLATRKVKKGWKEEVKFGVGNVDWVRRAGLKLKIVGVV